MSDRVSAERLAELDVEGARRIYASGEEAAVWALLELAKQWAEARMRDHTTRIRRRPRR